MSDGGDKMITELDKRAEAQPCPTCGREMVEVHHLTQDLYAQHRYAIEAWAEANGMDLPNTPVDNTFVIAAGQITYSEFDGDRRHVEKTIPLAEPWPPFIR